MSENWQYDVQEAVAPTFNATLHPDAALSTEQPSVSGDL
jgi:hypothetical protein